MTTMAKPASAAELGRLLELDAAAHALLEPGMSPRQFVTALRAHDRDLDALAVLAQALGKREAVWWGCVCAWHLQREKIKGPADAALAAAVRWVQEPSEEHRRSAGEAGMSAGIECAPGGIAIAAFWSGGSMNPPRLPVVEPPLTLTAVTISRVLLGIPLAALPDQRPQQRNDIFELGAHVADGKNHWTQPLIATAAHSS